MLERECPLCPQKQISLRTRIIGSLEPSDVLGGRTRYAARLILSDPETLRYPLTALFGRKCHGINATADRSDRNPSNPNRYADRPGIPNWHKSHQDDDHCRDISYSFVGKRSVAGGHIDAWFWRHASQYRLLVATTGEQWDRDLRSRLFYWPRY